MSTLSDKNLERLSKSELIKAFVLEHNGEWNHLNWLSFCEMLEKLGYTPIDLDQVGLLLEAEKAKQFPHRP